MAAERAGKSSDTMTAEALVLRAAETYLGLEMNVSCPGPADSMPTTPVISVTTLKKMREGFEIPNIALEIKYTLVYRGKIFYL